MNAPPTDTQSSHLDLDDLIAAANGQPIGDAAGEHLTGCEHCRLEASRWNLVADGVRSLAAATPEAAPPEAVPPEAAPPEAAPPEAVPPEAVPAAYPSHPGQLRRTGRRALARHRRRAVLVAGSAAAALVLLAGVGVGVGTWTGLVQVDLGGGASAEPVLTAVSGCPALESASGTLERMNGSSLVIKTPSGRPVTVTTTASTTASETGASAALLADITDGASVTVSGPSSDGTIAAFSVIIANPAQQHPQPPPGMVVVKGTVADASTAGFTVVTADGTRVPVTTSGDTNVSVLNASLGQFPVGVSILALGSAGPDGSLAAVGVVAIMAPPPASLPPSLPGARQIHVQTHAQGRQVYVKNCSPAAVDEALAAGG